MRIRDLTTVALRLYAFYLFFNCIPALYQLPIYWHIPIGQDSMNSFLLMNSVLTILLYIVAGVILLIFAERISVWIVPHNAQEETILVDSSSVARMGFGIAGAIVFIHGLQLLAYGLAFWYFQPNIGYGSFSRPELAIKEKAQIVESIVSIIVGLGLFLGKRRITDIAVGVWKFGHSLPGSKADQEVEEGKEE